MKAAILKASQARQQPYANKQNQRLLLERYASKVFQNLHCKVATTTEVSYNTAYLQNRRLLDFTPGVVDRSAILVRLLVK